jgi:hypothetical protein
MIILFHCLPGARIFGVHDHSPGLIDWLARSIKPGHGKRYYRNDILLTRIDAPQNVASS